MTQTQELIEQVRTKIEGATDYKIAQVLDIPRNVMHYYIAGERAADAYGCAKIAEILERDPLEVIAQVEAEAARTEKKREYWRSFFSGLKRTALGVGFLLTLGSSGGGWPGGAQASSASHNVRLRQPKTKTQRQNDPRKRVFFCLEADAQSRRKSQSSATIKQWHSAG